VKPRSIQVHIERLVLEGVAPGDRAGIAASVQQELTRLFAQHGVPGPLSRGIALPGIDAGAFRVAHRSRPSALGGGVARALYGGLKR
jgi:hypothetical protein